MVVHFGDFECGHCKRMAARLGQLFDVYGDVALFVYKDFPMTPECNPGVVNKKHRNACDAAVAAHCAREQGRFWGLHDLMFKNQHFLTATGIGLSADAAGVDREPFEACLAGAAAREAVLQDATLGTSLNIHGTPRVFINGTLFRSGTDSQAMALAIEGALGMRPERSGKSRLSAEAPVPTDVPAEVPALRRLDGFAIDTFEGAIVDGRAVSALGEAPSNAVSWYTAEGACRAAGKRMCTEAEWVTACQGAPARDDDLNDEFADDMIEGTAYPYGDLHDKARCWDGHADGEASDGTRWRAVYTGSMPGCVTPSGLYDPTGNLEEWAGDTAETAVLLGGAFDTSEDHARCYRRNDTFGSGYRSSRTGFRCCSD